MQLKFSSPKKIAKKLYDVAFTSKKNQDGSILDLNIAFYGLLFDTEMWRLCWVTRFFSIRKIYSLPSIPPCSAVYVAYNKLIQLALQVLLMKTISQKPHDWSLKAIQWHGSYSVYHY